MVLFRLSPGSHYGKTTAPKEHLFDRQTDEEVHSQRSTSSERETGLWT